MSSKPYCSTRVLPLFLTLLVFGCNLNTAPSEAEPAGSADKPSGPTFVLQRDTLVKTVEFSGRIAPDEEIALYFKSAGYVKQNHVRQGDRVQAGDLLAELETGELEHRIAQAELALKSAQLMVLRAKKQLEQQIVLAELDIAAAEARLAQAELANTFAITQAELSMVLAREELSRTQALSTTSDFGRLSYQYDLNIRDAALKQAETDLELLRRGIDPLLALDLQRAQLMLEQLKEGIDPLMANAVDQAKLDLERLLDSVNDSRIIAPVDGEVVSLSLLPDRPVEAFQTVLTIANPNALQVRAQPGTDQLLDLVEGQEATVFLNSVPGREWAGTIKRLPPPYGSAGAPDSEVNFDNAVLVSLQGDVSKLKPGKAVHVTVVLEEKRDVLWLPVDAVRTMQGRTFVVVQDGESQRRVNVELGLKGKDRVEIVAGLEEGQVVLLPDRTTEGSP